MSFTMISSESVLWGFYDQGDSKTKGYVMYSSWTGLSSMWETECYNFTCNYHEQAYTQL